MAPATSNPNFRKTAAGARLGKILFSKNSRSQISPAQITNLLRMAGVNIPKGVVVTADAAQIIMAGGVIVSNVETAASIGAYGAPTASAVQAAIELLGIIGVLDPKAPAVQIAKYGAEAYAAFSALGTNVAADIALVLDTYQQISKSTRPKTQAWEEFFTFGIGVSSVDEMLSGKNRLKDLTPQLQAAVDAAAKGAVYAKMNETQLAEVTKVSRSMLDYQAGKISVFEFMGSVAEQSPEIFYNYFPEAKIFLPPHFFRISGSSRVTYTQTGGIFGLSSRDYDLTSGYSQDFPTSHGYTRDEIILAITNYFLYNAGASKYFSSLNDQAAINLGYTTTDLLKLDKENIKAGKWPAPERRISMGDLACLSLFPPYFDAIDSNLNLSFTLQNLGLTPYDLGYEFVEDMKTNFDIFPELKNVVRQTPAVTMNGVEYFSDYQTGIQRVLKTKQALTDQLVSWDMKSDINSLAANDTGKAMIKKWSDIYGLISSATGDNAKQINPPARSIKNYFSVLSVLNELKGDKYIMSTLNSQGMIKGKLEALTGLAESIDDRFRSIQFLSVARKLNLFALTNIATFFGVSADKIKLSPLESGKLSFVM